MPPTRRRGLSLKFKLTGAMLLTIGAIAAIVHVPWVYTSRRNVQQMVSQLHEESFQGAQNDAAAFFDNVLAIQHIILTSLVNDLIELEDPNAQGQLYLDLLHAHENLTWVQMGFANGDYLGAQRRDDGLYDLHQRQWGDTLGALGEPGAELAAEQTQRARQIAIYEQTGDPNDLPGQPEWQIDTYQFTEDRDWVRVDQSTRSEFYYSPLRPFYQAALATPGENVWTDVYRFRTGNVLGLDAAIAYLDPDDNRVRGVVSISFGLRRISAYLADLRTPEEGLLFIVDSDGNLIAANDPTVLAETLDENETTAELLSLAAADNPRLQTVNQALQAENVVLSELSDMQEFSQYNPVTGQRYYIAVSPLGRLDWVIGSVTPEDVFLASVNQNQRRMLLVILGLLGGGVIVLWQISDRLLIRPILSVSDAAAAMETGNFHPESLARTAQRDDELGQLAEVFQDMAAVIGDREQSLMAQLEDLRDSGTGMAGSQLEVAYYQALTERAARLRADGPESSQFPPAASLSAYYRALKERAEAVRSTRISGAEVEQMLRGEDYLATLPDGDLRELASSAQRAAFSAHELIFQEGDGAEAVYAIAQGAVEILSTSQDAPLRTLGTGQLFGDLAIMLDIPRTTSARTRESTVLYTLDRDTFSRILRQNPQALEAVEHKLANYQDVLADAQLWFGDGHPQLAPGATWQEVVTQQLHHWWHGQLMERSVTQSR